MDRNVQRATGETGNRLVLVSLNGRCCSYGEQRNLVPAGWKRLQLIVINYHQKVMLHVTVRTDFKHIHKNSHSWYLLVNFGHLFLIDLGDSLDIFVAVAPVASAGRSVCNGAGPRGSSEVPKRLGFGNRPRILNGKHMLKICNLIELLDIKFVLYRINLYKLVNW